MTPKTVKSGILLPNLTTFMPLFFITFQTTCNFNILQSIYAYFFTEKRCKHPPPQKLEMLY